MSTPPKVFVSHASEDKARFVTEFATRLRASGIDAWLDRWEMLPGDSLVDKVFEEGIKGAAAFIVVLSKTSVQKKWVREEMNAAFVARLSRQCKVIPIVIDDCEVPEALKTTVWEPIGDLSSYDESLKRIVAAVFGSITKPPLGSPPAFVTGEANAFAPDLDRTDAAVLWRLCETAMEENDDLIADLTVLDSLEAQGLAQSDIIDALDVLDQRGLTKSSGVLTGGYRDSGVSHVRLTLAGLDLYVRHRFPSFDEMVAQVASMIVNENARQGAALSNATGYGQLVVEHIVDVLEHDGLIGVSRYFGGFTIHSVSASLKRRLR